MQENSKMTIILVIILGSQSFTRWLVWGARDSTRTSASELGKIAKFLCSHYSRVHKTQTFFYQLHLVGFECPHHLWLSTPLKLHSFSSKKTICRSPLSPKILGQKAKSNHQGDSNELTIKFEKNVCCHS